MIRNLTCEVTFRNYNDTEETLDRLLVHVDMIETSHNALLHMVDAIRRFCKRLSGADPLNNIELLVVKIDQIKRSCAQNADLILKVKSTLKNAIETQLTKSQKAMQPQDIWSDSGSRLESGVQLYSIINVRNKDESNQSLSLKEISPQFDEPMIKTEHKRVSFGFFSNLTEQYLSNKSPIDKSYCNSSN